MDIRQYILKQSVQIPDPVSRSRSLTVRTMKAMTSFFCSTIAKTVPVFRLIQTDNREHFRPMPLLPLDPADVKPPILPLSDDVRIVHLHEAAEQVRNHGGHSVRIYISIRSTRKWDLPVSSMKR